MAYLSQTLLSDFLPGRPSHVPPIGRGAVLRARFLSRSTLLSTLAVNAVGGGGLIPIFFPRCSPTRGPGLKGVGDWDYTLSFSPRSAILLHRPILG